ncbi:MAG: fatty acid desaturase [Hyphomicrobiales bacterium]
MQNFTHKDLIASLTEEQRAQILQKSDRAGLLHLALYLGALALCSAILLLQPPLYLLALVPQGILLVFLFTTLHETIHQTAFRSRQLNDAVAFFCGFLIFLPPTYFRYFHFAHHRHTHDPDRDPELASPKPDTLAAYLWAMTGLPEFISRPQIIVQNAMRQSQDTFVPPKGRAKVRREAVLFCALYGLVIALGALAGWQHIIMLWLLPLVVGGPFLRVYLLAEHALCPNVSNMLHNTRTTFTNRIVRFVAWNMPYHIVHHAYPAVPFHKLPEFHNIAKDHLGVTADGYVRFNQTYARTISAK